MGGNLRKAEEMRTEVDDTAVLPEGERTQEDVIAAILILFPDAEVASDDDGQLVINTNCMWSGKHGQNVLGNMNIGGEEGTCFRCDVHIESRVEVIWLDGVLRNDCGESEDGLPHEKDAPE